MIVAINQPYFSPYSGYFSLIAAADVFVIYDCVQFMRRGRIHRSQIHQSENFEDGWLTLPVEKAPQDTVIAEMMLRPLAQGTYESTHISLIQELANDMHLASYRAQAHPLTDFLHDHLTQALTRLRISTKVVRSSQMAISKDLKGQERILAICQSFGATQYINLPGGRTLYDPEKFRMNGIDLKFLDTSNCARAGYLQALAQGDFSLFATEALHDLRGA